MTAAGNWKLTSLAALTGDGGLMTDGDWIETKDQDPDGDVRLIQLADVGEGVFLNKSNRFLTMEKAKELRCTFLQPGDLLIARMPEPLGRACVFPGVDKPAVTAVDVCVWRAGQDGADPNWLMHAINSPQVRERILALAGGTTRQRISGGNLKRLDIPTPSPEDQRAIAAAVQALLNRSSLAEGELTKAERLAKRYRRSLLTAAFKGGLTASWRRSHTEEHRIADDLKGIDRRVRLPFGLPDGWGWRAVQSVARVTGGITQNAKRRSWPLQVPFLRVANVYANELRLADMATIGCTPAERDRTLLAAGDLLIVEGNGSIEQIGRVAIWDGSIDECVHQNHLIRLRVGADVSSKYLLYWLLSETARGAIETVASSSSGLHTLSISKVEGLPVPVAGPKEMGEIVEVIERGLSRWGTMTRELVRARQLRRRLNAAIRGSAYSGVLVVPKSNRDSLDLVQSEFISGSVV